MPSGVYVRSEKTKKKLAKLLAGYLKTEKYKKAKQAADIRSKGRKPWNTGKQLTEEQKVNMRVPRLSLRGRPLSLERRQQISRTLTGRKRPDLGGENHWKWIGGRIIDQHGYVRLKLPGDGYVLEHRAKMEAVLGRKLNPKEIVHHKNHKRHDNRLSNLQVLTHSEHMKLHKSWEMRTNVIAAKGGI